MPLKKKSARKMREESDGEPEVVTVTADTRVAPAQFTPEVCEDGDLRLYLEKYDMTGKANR